MADKRLIDNSSSTTVDNFYGNKSGADVQIPLAEAASVLAEESRSLRMIPTVTEVTDFDLITTAGVHAVDFYQKENSPFPNTYTGTLLVLRNAYGQCIQIAIVATAIQYRRRSGSGEWNAWLSFNLT